MPRRQGKDLAQNLMGLHEGMERLFDEMFRRTPAAVYGRDQVWSPAVDVYETTDGFIVRAELAGVDQEHLSVVFDQGVLVIAGCREDRRCGGRQSCHQMEISYGPFKRSVFVSKHVDGDGIKARFEGGMLEVFLPRVGSGRPKKVGIDID